MFAGTSIKKAQIALEFLIVYSFVLIVFIFLFALISTQRSTTLSQQQYSVLQLQAQNIATYIDQALTAGTGYYAVIPLTNQVGASYNVSISSTGVVIAEQKVGSQILTAYAFSNSKSLSINGTLISSKDNVSIYQLQNLKGTITIGNTGGTIYINKKPNSVTGYIQQPYITQIANVKTAAFNDSEPLSQDIVIPASNALITPNGFTYSFWLEISSIRKTCEDVFLQSQNLIYVTSSGNCNAGPHKQNELNFISGSFGYGEATPIQSDSWVYVALVYKSTTGGVTWYLNGTAVASQPVFLAPNTKGATYIGGISSNCINGSMADVQIYSNALPLSQIRALYNNGMSGGPVNSSIVGWWPLNGNANDYSGNGNNGAPSNNTYQSVIQSKIRLLSGSGTPITDRLVGLVTNKGSLGINRSSDVVYTNSSGEAEYFITSNNTGRPGPGSNLGNGFLNIDYLNTVINPGGLVGWWPMDTGFGNTIYDLYAYHNGVFNNALWKPLNQKIFVGFDAALFPGDSANIMDSNTQDGFIAVNASSPLLNTVKNNSFSVVSWVYYNGITPQHAQGIFGNWAGSGGGFQLEGYSPSNVVLYIAGNPVNFAKGSNSIPQGEWEMLAAEYNGTTGLASVYLNNTLIASNALPKRLALTQNAPPALPYYIGGDADQTGGLDTFNGLITNLQFYSYALPQQQIDTLYSQGLTSSPLGNSGLIGWWPLAGNARDSSYNNDNGVVNYNVIFAGSSYLGKTDNSTFGLATFKGSSNAVIPYNPSFDISGQYTVMFTFATTGSGSFDYDLLNTTTPSGGDTLDIQLCNNAIACSAIGPTASFSGIHSLIGSGSGSWITISADYPFVFQPYKNYNFVETVNQTGWSIYINTQLVANGTYSSSTPLFMNTNGNILLGGGAGTLGFHGYISNFFLFNQQLARTSVPNVAHYTYNVSMG